nr:hypothetical protein [Desulfobulbaceae bacterium]
MKKYLALINDFAHDFFTALWLASLFVLFLVNQEIDSAVVDITASRIISTLLHNFFWLQTWSMVLIILTGIGRYLHVKGQNTKDSYDQQRKTLLIAKHVVLGVLFVGGSVLGFLWR